MTDPKNVDDTESFVTNVPLTDIFGSHPKTRIIGALLTMEDNPPTHFSTNEISRIAGIDAQTVDDHVRDLAAYDLVVETDQLEGEVTYKLNEENKITDDIRRLSDQLLEQAPE